MKVRPNNSKFLHKSPFTQRKSPGPATGHRLIVCKTSGLSFIAIATFDFVLICLQHSFTWFSCDFFWETRCLLLICFAAFVFTLYNHNFMYKVATNIYSLQIYHSTTDVTKCIEKRVLTLMQRPWFVVTSTNAASSSACSLILPSLSYQACPFSCRICKVCSDITFAGFPIFLWKRFTISVCPSSPPDFLAAFILLLGQEQQVAIASELPRTSLRNLQTNTQHWTSPPTAGCLHLSLLLNTL